MSLEFQFGVMTKLDMSSRCVNSIGMQNIKISSKVDEAVWNELRALAKEQHQNVSGLLTEAIREYLVEMSAALFESLIMNHPFVDGNKRVAFFATDVFLRLNGYKIEVAVSEAHPFLIGLLEKGECNYENLLPWIRGAIVRF